MSCRNLDIYDLVFSPDDVVLSSYSDFAVCYFRHTEIVIAACNCVSFRLYRVGYARSHLCSTIISVYLNSSALALRIASVVLYDDTNVLVFCVENKCTCSLFAISDVVNRNRLVIQYVLAGIKQLYSITVIRIVGRFECSLIIAIIHFRCSFYCLRVLPFSYQGIASRQTL